MTETVSFDILPCIQFSCVQCGCTLQHIRYGEHHMASGFACLQCGAYYHIDWKSPTERTTIEVKRSEGGRNDAEMDIELFLILSTAYEYTREPASPQENEDASRFRQYIKGGIEKYMHRQGYIHDGSKLSGWNLKEEEQSS